MKAIRFQDKIKKKKQKARKRRIIALAILGTTILGVGFYLLFISSLFRLQNIKIVAYSGDLPAVFTDQEKQAVENIVKNGLSAKFLFFWKNNSLFLFDEKAVGQGISGTFPGFKKVIIDKKLNHEILVSIYKRKPTFACCFGENCFVADEGGVVFKPLENEMGLILTQQAGPPKPLLSECLSEQARQAISTISGFLENQIVDERFTFILEDLGLLKAQTESGFYIYFDITLGVDTALQKLQTFLASRVTAEQLKNLQYIDLRFSKTYYK